jgi:hypothetical protein
MNHILHELRCESRRKLGGVVQRCGEKNVEPKRPQIYVCRHLATLRAVTERLWLVGHNVFPLVLEINYLCMPAAASLSLQNQGASLVVRRQPEGPEFGDSSHNFELQ